MNTPEFRIELLADHDRTEFDCRVPELNQYFQTQVGQDTRRNVTTCYVAIDKETEKIAGYYSIAMSSVSLADLPEKTVKRLPRYPRVPVVRIGRLAVDHRYQGRQLGSGLLADALGKAIRSGVACFAAVVDAKDDDAVAFYEHYGFAQLSNSPKCLFLPISDALVSEFLTDTE